MFFNNFNEEEVVMSEINIKFPDGNVKGFEQGTTTEDIAQSISPGLRKKQ